MAEIERWVNLAMTILWIGTDAMVAVAAFYRFRTTATGLLIGGSFSVLAFKAAMMNLINRFLLQSRPYDDSSRTILILISHALTVALLIVVAVGIALIPRSLNRLARPR